MWQSKKEKGHFLIVISLLATAPGGRFKRRHRGCLSGEPGLLLPWTPSTVWSNGGWAQTGRNRVSRTWRFPERRKKIRHETPQSAHEILKQWWLRGHQAHQRFPRTRAFALPVKGSTRTGILEGVEVFAVSLGLPDVHVKNAIPTVGIVIIAVLNQIEVGLASLWLQPRLLVEFHCRFLSRLTTSRATCWLRVLPEIWRPRQLPIFFFLICCEFDAFGHDD